MLSSPSLAGQMLFGGVAWGGGGGGGGGGGEESLVMYIDGTEGSCHSSNSGI